MKIHTGMIMAGMLTASLMCAESHTQLNFAIARTATSAMHEAHGSEQWLSELSTIRIRHDGIDIAGEQSRAAGQSWDNDGADSTASIAEENWQPAEKQSFSAGC